MEILCSILLRFLYFPYLVLIFNRAKKDNKLGMVQPKVYKAWNNKILDTTGLIFRYGNRYSWEHGLGYVIDRGQNEYDEGQYDSLTDIIGCCACAVLYRVDMLKSVGLFWEKLWSMGEDVELSWRAYKRGWKAKYVPSAIVYHRRGATTNKSEETMLKIALLNIRNMATTVNRYGTPLQKLLFATYLIYTGIKSAIGKRIGRNKIWGKPYFEAIKNIDGVVIMVEESNQLSRVPFCKPVKPVILSHLK